MKFAALCAVTTMVQAKEHSMHIEFLAGYFGAFIHRNYADMMSDCWHHPLKGGKERDPADDKAMDDAITAAVNAVASSQITTCMSSFMNLGKVVGAQYRKYGDCVELKKEFTNDPEMMKWKKKYHGANKALIPIDISKNLYKNWDAIKIDQTETKNNFD